MAQYKARPTMRGGPSIRRSPGCAETARARPGATRVGRVFTPHPAFKTGGRPASATFPSSSAARTVADGGCSAHPYGRWPWPNRFRPELTTENDPEPSIHGRMA
jgi:hypothetical protein